jgi:N-acetyl-anhydromuramyl-L-alanine amidase AmpD
LIGAGRAETAVHEWNELIDRKLLPYNKLDPASGSSLTDGSFQAAPSGSGFDWRTLYPESIRFSFMESEHTYRFDFDGTAPQQADLLSQLVPLLPNRTYQLRSRYHAGFDAAKSGIHWAVNINNLSIPVRLAGTDTTIVAEFRTPDQTTAGNLVLSYARQPGTTLIHGPFDLLQTSLNLL